MTFRTKYAYIGVFVDYQRSIAVSHTDFHPAMVFIHSRNLI